MSLHLYNTLNREKERFKPLRQDEVKIYFCGPTPYNYAHIGNLRAYLFEDIVIRTLKFLGYRVKTVMNVTDIDDKTIRDSQKSGKTLKEFTEFYTAEFLKDLDRLGIQRADTIAPISTLIDEMRVMIQGLLDRDFAYIADDGSVYYRVEKFKNYGKLANLDTKGMISSVRINNDEYDKDQIADFALWKAYNSEADGENFWEIEVFEKNGDEKISRILKGRPGWHIECSACNYKFFGEQIDIHMGGIDNLFPHHQNEVAQTEAFTGKQFSKYWLHGGHLLVDNKKMSKSAGNFYTLRDIIEKWSEKFDEKIVCRAMRLMNLQNRYRENFNFTNDRLESAINTIKGMDEMMKRLGFSMQDEEENTERTARGKLKFHDITREFRDNIQGLMQDFVAFLEDDFSTPEALTVVFEMHSWINSGIDENLFSLEEKKALVGLMKTWDEVLGIYDFSLLDNKNDIPENIIKLAEARKMEKDLKNWSEADKIRDEITNLGYKMIDEKDGKFRIEKI
ncbi:MAG: cysteine--tRNA ligase [Candidatus Altimarinota bacterium]